jgi:predicted Zn-dependent peptidase
MIKSWILPNKARLVVEEIPYLKSAAVGIFIKVGSRHEPPELSGGSHFIEHMLFFYLAKGFCSDIKNFYIAYMTDSHL